MIIDIHSHAWPTAESDSSRFLNDITKMKAKPIEPVSSYDRYRATAASCDVTVVFGGKARLTDFWVEDRVVADYVAQDPACLIGFMSLDPTQPGWQEEMRYGHQALGLKGIKLMPAYAGFFPQDSALDPLWTYAQKHCLPVLVHTGTAFTTNAVIDCALPRNLDEVSRRFPEVRLTMTHLGHPYEAECLAIIRKQPHVYADLSDMHNRPWQLFHSLMLVHEYDAWDKLFFGSNYPFTTVDETLAGLKSLCNINMDRFSIPREKIEEVIHRDALACLNLPCPDHSKRVVQPRFDEPVPEVLASVAY
jgi:predicted TIM-barrel fold metal-dependent hydrolase